MKLFNIVLEKEKMIIHMDYVHNKPHDLKVVISDINLDCPYMVWNGTFEPYNGYWITPLSARLTDIIRNSNKFEGFMFKVFTADNRLLQKEILPVNKYTPKPSYFHCDSFDITGHSYLDFFYGDLCSKIDTSGVVIDAGANVGMFTLFCKNNARRIYSIEPDTFPFYYLEKNFKNIDNIILINKALSDSCNPIKFNYNLFGSVASSEMSRTEHGIELMADTIDIPTIIEVEDNINLVKLDIEGTEFKVMESLQQKHFKKINQFFIEFHADSQPIKNILISNGYTVEYRSCLETDNIGFIYGYKE